MATTKKDSAPAEKKAKAKKFSIVLTTAGQEFSGSFDDLAEGFRALCPALTNTETSLEVVCKGKTALKTLNVAQTRRLSGNKDYATILAKTFALALDAD